MRRRTFLLSLGAWSLAACGRGNDRAPAPTPLPTATRPVATTAPAPTATSSPVPSATPTATDPRIEPIGFPIDPAARLGMVSGVPGNRAIRWGEGPTALEYSRDDQPSGDPDRANRCGWNARLHVEYEGQPAVDWYIPPGTPVVATLDGTATLLINTVSNPFDVYGVSREPYLGNPDRALAPVVPFPGPGGGQGVFVRIENAGYRTDSAHFDIGATAAAVPRDAWLEDYGPETDFVGAFAELRDFRVATPVARWEVRAGEVIGASGDSGYSEAPHLHYAIRPAGSPNALCPTTEPGFDDGGWLLRGARPG
ncbi:MAG: M23 family metallopeptidase [Chloroflexi bacterium]|nr:M23 family metallopeptidase [Chloroflexota bacterium]